MKHRVMIFLLAAACSFFILVNTAPAGTPHLISYQGRATDASGNPVADGSHNAWFFLYTSSSGATWVWNDYSVIQTKDGLFSYVLGSDPTSPLPDSIFIRHDSLFLGVQFDGQMQTPLTPLASAPYAIRVNTLDEAGGGDIYGEVRLHDSSEYNLMYGLLSPDNSGNGAGFLAIMKDGGMTTAFSVDGNWSGTGYPRMYFSGLSNATFDLTTTGNNSIQLPSNSIKSPEIANEAGVGSYINQTGYEVTAPAGQLTYLGSRAMFAPSNGYVLVMASAEVQIHHGTSVIDRLVFGLTDNCTSLYASSKISLQLSGSLPAGFYYLPVTVHGLFPVDSGTTTFCFMVDNESGSYSKIIENITITELFVPTAYTTVIQPSAPAPPGGPEAERASELSFHEARLQAELEQMKAEVEAMKEELRNVKEVSSRE